jgi:hypothetical protein
MGIDTPVGTSRSKRAFSVALISSVTATEKRTVPDDRVSNDALAAITSGSSFK